MYIGYNVHGYKYVFYVEHASQNGTNFQILISTLLRPSRRG